MEHFIARMYSYNLEYEFQLVLSSLDKAIEKYAMN